jgi:uncharacterized protein (TIGR03086 family)
MNQHDTPTPTLTTVAPGADAGASGSDLGDPRPLLHRAATTAGEVIAGVRAAQHGDPTPCPDYDVRGLVQHLFGVIRRTAAIGRGEDAAAVAPVQDVASEVFAATWAEAITDVEDAWSDPAVLGEVRVLPFAAVPGAVAAILYTGELTVHTWDLATATGQTPNWDPAVVAASLEGSRRGIPAEPRGGPVPFGSVVEVPGDAPPIDQLIGWVGRRP